MSRFEKARILCCLVFSYILVRASTFELLEINNHIKKNIEIQKEEGKVIGQLWELANRHEVLNERCWSENATVLLRGFEVKVVDIMCKDCDDKKEKKEKEIQSPLFHILMCFLILLAIISIMYCFTLRMSRPRVPPVCALVRFRNNLGR